MHLSKSVELLIPKPCSQDWETMQGGRAQRHCSSCNRNVHNFAAMSRREINSVLAASSDRICARIVHRADGSIVTRELRKTSPAGGTFLLAVTLGAGTAASAQSPNASPPTQAVLTGKILLPDGSGPLAGAHIKLQINGESVSETVTGRDGTFRIGAPPGTYDISIRQNALFGSVVKNTNLHEGEQSIAQIRTHFGLDLDNAVEFTTMGELLPTLSYPASYAVRHPFRYLHHLLSSKG